MRKPTQIAVSLLLLALVATSASAIWHGHEDSEITCEICLAANQDSECVVGLEHQIALILADRAVTVALAASSSPRYFSRGSRAPPVA